MAQITGKEGSPKVDQKDVGETISKDKGVIVSGEIKDVPPTSQKTQIESKPAEETVEVSSKLLSDLVERLETLESKEYNPAKEARSKYTGPRSYSFKKRGGVPILSYTSFKKDKTKGLSYKRHGQYVNNHHVKLLLADGDSVEVDINDFSAHYERSEKMNCKVSVDEKGEISYTFSGVEDYDDFTVLEKVIN